MHINIPNVFRPPGEAHLSPFPQRSELRSKVCHIQKAHQIQKVYHIGIVFTNMLPCKHIFQNISSLTRAWHRSGLADDGGSAGGSVQQKKDSDHSSAALTAVSGRTESSITERDMKDGVPLVQSCSAEVQSNSEAEEMCLPSRGAADVPEPQWRIPYLRRQVCAASWLRRITGTARCLLCSEWERREERPPLPGKWSDGNTTKANPVVFWDCGLLTVLFVLLVCR